MWLGKRSYGIYLFYWPVLMLTREYHDVRLSGNALLGLRAGITVTLAALSYRLVEEPVRNGALGRLWSDLRRRRGPFEEMPRSWVAVRAATVVVAAFAVATTLVVARPAPPPADFLAVQVAEAAPSSPILPTLPSTTTTVAATTTSVAEQVAIPVTSTTTTTTVVAASLPQSRITGLGDSVLLVAKAELERRLPDAAIDAEVGRQFKELVGLARALRDGGALGDEVILQLGNNGPVTASQFDEIMDVLKDVWRVVVINVKVARPWEAPNNAMLADGVTRWPNAVLLDWHRHGAARPELFADDGTHMGPTGVRVFVELVLAHL